jgi:hypothetical protein
VSGSKERWRINNRLPQRSFRFALTSAYVNMRGMADDIVTSHSPAVPPIDPAALTMGLKRLRRRRWYLWSVILVYLPLMSSTLRLSPVFQVRATVFGAWFVLLLVTALVAALVRCPRCGNYFHVHGMTFLCLRQCLHCQLHVCQDKKSRGVESAE